MLSQEQLARAAAVCPSLGLSLGALLWVWTGLAHEMFSCFKLLPVQIKCDSGSGSVLAHLKHCALKKSLSCNAALR